MIRVNRTSPPKNLTRYAQRWRDELLTAIQQYEAGGLSIPDNLWHKYNKPYVKTALIEMFHHKCAYCETKHESAALHIEHYRPKKKYPRYTFEWQNLLLACITCNTVYKGEQFPLQEADENNPLLLNPCEDDPAQHLYFEQARLVPLSERGQQTRDLLDLNRDELFDRRRDLLRKIDYIRRAIADCERNGNPIMAQEGQILLNAAASAEAEYTAMVRCFLINPLPEKPPL